MLHIVHKKLIISGIIFLLSWLIGTYLIHRFEAGHPIGESYFNAFYFTVITTATIGYGDLVPMTTEGKWIAMGYAVFYVPLFLYVMTLIFQSNIEKLKRADERIEKGVKTIEKDIGEVRDTIEDGGDITIMKKSPARKSRAKK